jgi:L-alanine-DL-glutamate epimerase-like enolase superfamily enzyme
VRDAIGPERTLVIDAVGGWDADTAISRLRELAGCAIAWVEQPTVAGDHTAMARVKVETGCRMIADDSCFTLVEARELIHNRCCDAFSLYPGKNGGIRKAREIADLARAHGLLCTVGSNGEGDVGTAAAGHLCISSDAFDLELLPGDLCSPAIYEFSVVTTPVPIRGPVTTLTEAAGLGVEIDWVTVRANPARR